MLESQRWVDNAKVRVTAVALAASGLLIGACGGGPDNNIDACPKGWRTDLKVDAGQAVGVLGAIGETAVNNEFSKELGDVRNAFRDESGFSYRNAADQVDEVACKTDKGVTVLNPSGAKLVAVAARHDIELGALSPLGDKLMGERGVDQAAG